MSTPLPLLRVETTPRGYVPICRYCNFAGRPRTCPSDARGAINNHATSAGHRLAVARASIPR